MKKQIDVTIMPDGSLKIEAKGFQNKECLKATKELEESLGSVTSRKMKSTTETQKERLTHGN